MTPAVPPRITVAAIKAAVAAEFAIPIAEMTSPRRTRGVARPRQVAMALACELSKQSLPAIGHLFGDRDHTTVLHARQQIARLRHTDGEFDRRVTRLSLQLRGAVYEQAREIQLEFLIGPLFDQAGMLGHAA